MADSPTPPNADAPASPGPEGEPNVEIALGPDPSIYPENLRAQPEAPPAPPDEAPEPAEDSAPDTQPEVAGAESSPPPQGETRGTRRKAADEAYQRGVDEGRQAYEREQAQRAQQDAWEQTQREANSRVEQLFADLNAADYATQDRARQGILQMYHGNRDAQALMTTTRQQILAEMAADFGKLRDLDGVNDADYQNLHAAPSAADLAKRAFDLGKRSSGERIARLEAELLGLRGRLVGSRATPERANGGGSSDGSLSIEQYAALSAKDARQLSAAQVDAMTRQLAADAANGRT